MSWIRQENHMSCLEGIEVIRDATYIDVQLTEQAESF